jgi:hypothetical protein
VTLHLARCIASRTFRFYGSSDRIPSGRERVRAVRSAVIEGLPSLRRGALKNWVVSDEQLFRSIFDRYRVANLLTNPSPPELADGNGA